MKISFHTFRKWEPQCYTTEPKTFYVKQFLGHKLLKSTEIYTNIEHILFEASDDAFTVEVAQKPEEVKSLLEVGFEYVCQKDNVIFLRNPK